MESRAIAWILVCWGVLGWTACARNDAEPRPRFEGHAGRYAVDRLAAAEVEAVGDLIAVVPPFWTGKPYFLSDDGASFLMELPSPRPDRRVTFGDFVDGVPRSLTMTEIEPRYDGMLWHRLDPGVTTALGLFLEGDAAGAAALALEAAGDDETLVRFALDVLLKYPSRHPEAVTLLERLRDARPGHARLRSLYAHALVAVDRRDEALKQFEAARALDPEDRTVTEGLRRLRFREPPPGEGYRALLPFTLDEALAPPTHEEIAAVRADWAARDLSPRNVRRPAGGTVELDHARLEARVLRHDVHGDTHYGVVFVPAGADAGSRPAVIDVRGVDPTYSPLDVSHGTKTLRALGPAQSEFVFLVPGLRGNTLIFDGSDYVSGGDPSDAWDGATDDALALLEAALEVTPEIDPEKIAVVGYSRGGTVALLAGIRDPRIDLVLNVVGPVDHLVAMDSHLGWTTGEVLADALRDGTVPGVTEEGGQDFDHFFDRVLEGETLAGVRARLIASSPLYFVEDLPETHSYYGSEDRSVPLANPKLLRARLAELGRLDRDTTLRVFEGRGHDTDPRLIQRETTHHLTAWADR